MLQIGIRFKMAPLYYIRLARVILALIDHHLFEVLLDIFLTGHLALIIDVF